MNTTMYNVTSKPFIAEWLYIVIGLSVSVGFFFISGGVIMMRNYH
jgi:hypothetical protein